MKSPGNGGSVVKDRETQAVPTDLENTSWYQEKKQKKTTDSQRRVERNSSSAYTGCKTKTKRLMWPLRPICMNKRKWNMKHLKEIWKMLTEKLIHSPSHILIYTADIDPVDNEGKAVNSHAHGDGWHEIADGRRTRAFYGQSLARCIIMNTSIEDASSIKVALKDNKQKSSILPIGVIFSNYEEDLYFSVTHR